MAIKRAALSQFISLSNCLLLQRTLCFAQTHTYPPPLLFSDLYLNLCLRLCLSLHLVPHSFFLSPTVLSPLLDLDTLPLVSPYTGSHLCTTDTLINPGFVLLQKGVGCPSGSTLIAVWEHRPGLLSTFKPIFSSPPVVFSYRPHISSFSRLSPLHHFIYIFFFSFSCSVLPSPAVPHITLM